MTILCTIINYFYISLIENSPFLLKNFIGLNDNQHNIIKIIKANKILDDDIKRVDKIANIKFFNRNSINNDRDLKQSEIKNEVLNYINIHIKQL